MKKATEQAPALAGMIGTNGRTAMLDDAAVDRALQEHAGYDHKGIWRECIQDVHFCIDDYGPPIMPMKVIQGDCVEVMRGMESDSIDAIVTDPPYGLTEPRSGSDGSGKMWQPRSSASKASRRGGFMGKAWDGTGVAFDAPTWAAALRILKPGGHLLAFGAPRTFHRLTCAIEDAGFEIRDCLSWLYGSGFPKSLNIGDGRGTALKPAWEPCVMARKPLIGTVAANVERWGTGAINVDASRIEGEPWQAHDATVLAATKFFTEGEAKVIHKEPHTGGRWPANVALDEEAAAILDAQSGERQDRGSAQGYNGWPNGTVSDMRVDLDSGGASRFFYTAKATRAEREAWGRMTLPAERRTDGRAKDIDNPRLRTSKRVNDHPTVKPLALMEWLIKLVVPDGGIVLDPFCGSGSTLVAAKRLNVRAIGIEQDKRSVEIARQRIDAQWEVRML